MQVRGVGTPVREAQCLGQGGAQLPAASPSGRFVACALVGGRRATPGGSKLARRRAKQHGRLQVKASVQVEAPPGQAPPAPSPPVPVSASLLEVSPGVSVLRCCTNERLKFEVEYSLRRGTSDNTYLITGDNGNVEVLLDVPDQAFTEAFVAQLRGAGPLSSLRHVVVSHLTPKRLDSLKALLQLLGSEGPAEGTSVWLSNPALQVLRNSLGADAEGAALLSRVTLHAVRADTVLPTTSTAGGSEGALRFIPAPTPRWPDLLLTYAPGAALLFASKLFSAHVSPPLLGQEQNAYDEGGWEVYGEDWRYFYECTLLPVARQAQATLERLDLTVVPAGGSTVLGLQSGWLLNLLGLGGKAGGAQAEAAVGDGGLQVTLLAPLHGPVVSASVQELLRNYRSWTEAQVKVADECSVLVLYASAYGNTAALATAISRGITKAGVGVEQLNLELSSIKEVEEALERCGGFVIGSPTLGGHMPTQVQTALGTIIGSPKAQGMPAGVFGSFGWSGEAVDEMEQKLKDGAFALAFESVRCKFKPTAAVLQVCEESGTDIAQKVRRRKKSNDRLQAETAAPRVVGGTGAQQALGRMVGSLSVVTARDGDAVSGMLASWISQASFDPPGLSIALKKDRAVEPLMPKGAKFVVNILAEGKERPIVKHLYKQFAPGEDRFAALPHRESEASGCVVLEDAAAVLECSVVDKMEAGDHWVVYAQVDSGEVLDDNALAAVHHRKIGTTY